jgi:hypothetical protein
MWESGRARIIPAMTRPVTSPRVLLVKDRRAGEQAPAPVPLRRYRLARLRLGDRPAEPEGRFEYLKRARD